MSDFGDKVLQFLLGAMIIAIMSVLVYTITHPEEPETYAEFTGEIIYKGAYFVGYDEMYYIIVEADEGNQNTFKTPSYLWIQLKEGATWTYLPPK